MLTLFFQSAVPQRIHTRAELVPQSRLYPQFTLRTLFSQQEAQTTVPPPPIGHPTHPPATAAPVPPAINALLPLVPPVAPHSGAVGVVPPTAPQAPVVSTHYAAAALGQSPAAALIHAKIEQAKVIPTASSMVWFSLFPSLFFSAFSFFLCVPFSSSHSFPFSRHKQLVWVRTTLCPSQCLRAQSTQRHRYTEEKRTDERKRDRG